MPGGRPPGAVAAGLAERLDFAGLPDAAPGVGIRS
jgi:hypothetical protein